MWLWGVVIGCQGAAMQLLRCYDCFEYCKHVEIWLWCVVSGCQGVAMQLLRFLAVLGIVSMLKCGCGVS